MNRRRFLELAVISSPFFAGCSGQTGTPTEERTETTPKPTATPTSTPTASPTKTPTDTPSDTAVEAVFELSAPSYPDTIRKGETAELSVQIKNIGGREGSTPVVLRIGNLTLSKEVELAPGSSKTVVFGLNDSTGYPESGSYKLNIEAIASSEVISGFEIAIKRGFPDSYFVGPDGSDDNTGKRESPLGSIQEGINRASAGETIRVLSGEYRENLLTKRSGDPGDPITITGPQDAVVRPPEVQEDRGRVLDVVHSHVHLTGLTFDGLAIPEESQTPGSYSSKLIETRPPTWQDNYPDYLKDIKIKPHAVGNAQYSLINTIRTNKTEIGEFELIGPAGVRYLYSNEWGHVGEIVSLGVSSDNIGSSWYPWDEPDQSHGIRVHHILNKDGHSHTELVEVHQGMYDVTIDYCTDVGGSGKFKLNEDKPPSDEAAMALRGAKSTLRWSIVENGLGAGVHIGNSGLKNRDKFEALPEDQFPGTKNSLYGNRLVDNEGLAVAFQSIRHDADFDNGPDEQKVICGNEYNGETQGKPGKSCSDDIPEAEKIGHLGGDSPWA